MARRQPRQPVKPPAVNERSLPFSGVTAVPAGLLTARERLAEIAAILARGALRVLAGRPVSGAPGIHAKLAKNV
ncbi:MAG: hypothetical protein FWG74_04765 [Planctomycetes bacterium]|nr:hypothetical protein [Planctomycetota bacterium]